MTGRLFLLVCVLLSVPASAGAEFYRYVDRNGIEFYTNDRKQVPREYQDSATVVTPDQERISVGKTPPRTAGPGREHRDKYGRGEEYWRRKAENLRLKLRDQQEEYEVVLRRLDEQEQKAGGGRKKSASSLEKKRQKLEREMSRTRRALEVDLPEEARRADAYPGWLRE